MYYHW